MGPATPEVNYDYYLQPGAVGGGVGGGEGGGGESGVREGEGRGDGKRKGVRERGEEERRREGMCVLVRLGRSAIEVTAGQGQRDDTK